MSHGLFTPHPPRILATTGANFTNGAPSGSGRWTPHQLQRAIVNEPDAGWRPLFPHPGYPLVVRWNEFRSLLGTQIAHPERLRDAHRVGYTRRCTS